MTTNSSPSASSVGARRLASADQWDSLKRAYRMRTAHARSTPASAGQSTSIGAASDEGPDAA
ncbi:hypothetical protein QT381_03505 [Galbitalea sp. SE-J8]|uniref:hypothetical protein n=1 Tax=Galbitalea sp. SE-J8 TaxID=3054952 RepID=UPI00259C9C51|nr:hypothetical protein [Galbitalea sp. SE-J8]MDM4762069.1 hypothetical protein [Galbitalea sp. SE-J8]